MSSHVWNPRFVYRDIVHDATSITATDEVVGMEDSFLKSFQPQEVWRADTLSSLSVAVVADAQEFDTMALLYTNATAKRNALVQSNDIDTTWTATNATIVDNANIIAPLSTKCHRVTASGAGSVQHGYQQTWTPTLTMAGAEEFTTAFYINVSILGANPDAVRLAMATGVNEVYVDLDLTAFTVGSVTEGTGWSGSTASVSSFSINGNTVYRVILTATQSAVVSALVTRIRMVMAGSVTFVQASEEFLAAQHFTTMGDTTIIEPNTTTDHMAALRFTITGATVLKNLYPLAPRQLVDRIADRGWIHGAVYSGAAVDSATAWTVEISDEANLDTWFQAGRLIIGKAWHPMKAITGGSQSHEGNFARLSRELSGGSWVYSVELDFLNQDAVRELMDMEVYCNPAGSAKVTTVAEGGQRYRKGARPALFLADDAAESYEPERVVYGYVNVNSVRSGKNGLSSARVEIEEMLP